MKRQSVYTARYRKKHPEKCKQMARESCSRRNRKLKQEWLEAYGGKCECCGESIVEFMSVEHRKGGGIAHRREVGFGPRLLNWLKKRGWPKKDFGCLCMNCNFAKGHSRNGECPHVTMAWKRAGVCVSLLVGMLLASILSGCAGLVETTTVEVPIPVACDPPQVLEPSKPVDGLDPARATAFEFERALWATVEALEGHAEQLRASADACRSR